MLHGRAIPWPLKRPKLEHMADTVVTRFAPSPTGYLHIGGARTALFNWLYARHTGGKFLLRIEDTDRERSTEPAIKAILDGLKWLELDWDGEPLFQFARAARHREVAEELLAAGKAYRCYLTPPSWRLCTRRSRRSARWRNRRSAPQGPADDPEPLARSRSEAGARRRQARAAPAGATRRRDRARRQGAGPRRVCRTASSTT